MAQSEDKQHGKGQDDEVNPDVIGMPGGQRSTEGQAKGHDKHDDEHPGQGKGHNKHDDDVNPDIIGMPGGQ